MAKRDFFGFKKQRAKIRKGQISSNSNPTDPEVKVDCGTRYLVGVPQYM